MMVRCGANVYSWSATVTDPNPQLMRLVKSIRLEPEQQPGQGQDAARVAQYRESSSWVHSLENERLSARESGSGVAILSNPLN